MAERNVVAATPSSPEVPAAPPPRGFPDTIRCILDALAGTLDKKSEHRVRKALEDLNRALASGLWSDDSTLRGDGSKAFCSLTAAARELLKIRDASPAISSLLLALADAAKELAQIGIDRAVVTGGNAEELARAEEEIRRGDQAVAAGDFVRAIQFYEQAWKRSQDAQ